MLILGVDPGSNATGYGVIDSRGGQVRALEFGAIRPDARAPFLQRLPVIAARLAALVDRIHPEVAAIEDIFMARNSRVALQLGHVRGAALLPILQAGIPVHAYAPRLVKKAVVGYGAAEKEQVRRMVRMLLGIHSRPLSLDASDALAVAICHAHTAPQARLREAAGS